MNNPYAEFAYHVTSGLESVYNGWQKVTSRIGPKPKEDPPNTVEKSAAWFAEVMAAMIMDGSDGEASVESIKNHHKSEYHATIEGYAEENSDWLLVGHGGVSHEQRRSASLAKGGHEQDPAAPDETEPPSDHRRSNKRSHQHCNWKKHERYVSKADETEILEKSEQSSERNCHLDTRDDRAELRGSSEYMSCLDSGISRLIEMTDEERHTEMDTLIEDLRKFTVREHQTTVDAEEQSQSESSSMSGSEETTNTSTAEDISCDFPPEPAGVESRSPSSSPTGKRLGSLVNSGAKAVRRGWKGLFKRVADKPEETAAACLRFLELYRHYSLEGPDRFR